MDYRAKENAVLEFIKTHLNEYTVDLDAVTHFYNEWLDLSRYNFDVTLWTDFNAYAYQDLSSQSRLETGSLVVYIVCRNAVEQVLHDRLRDYTSAFFNMFEDTGCNFGGHADYGIIESVKFFDAAEGNPTLKVAEMTITFYKEED
ncbi:MAG: hypothetical protein LBH75_04650 [Treponema sp.]|jgi:hypothetical protein|nr:hypothetical protein [Treponema sp.]